jgi:hypothetical protein
MALVPVELADAPAGSVLVSLLDGLIEHPLDGAGRTELGLDPYGYRRLKLVRPDDDPII